MCTAPCIRKANNTTYDLTGAGGRREASARKGGQTAAKQFAELGKRRFRSGDDDGGGRRRGTAASPVDAMKGGGQQLNTHPHPDASFKVPTQGGP
jgi:hypothetical protein